MKFSVWPEWYPVGAIQLKKTSGTNLEVVKTVFSLLTSTSYAKCKLWVQNWIPWSLSLKSTFCVGLLSIWFSVNNVATSWDVFLVLKICFGPQA